MTELVLPQHTNALGTVFGGTVMAWIDIAAAIAAQRHCGKTVVTAAVDDLTFVGALRLGDIARISARVNATFRSSVEVAVTVEQEDLRTMARSICVDALLTFVALDEKQKPTSVPPLVLENADDHAHSAAAHSRREARLARRTHPKT
ncbi:MAG: acyl-CoA thioesterase [Sandaracinaceae bacterium]|nr:acyl-CoA thioesterase [Sandaracinaceae bacterium]